MGHPVDFDGSNVVMRAPEGAENVQDMHVYRTRHSCVSCWTFTSEELVEISRTGRIFLSVLAGGQPPVYVGSESACRKLMVDFGPVWPMSRQPAAPAPQEAGWTPPQDCDGKEQLAFEAWASGKRYDMHQHPLHYLFMDKCTNAARQGWKAALEYVREQHATNAPAPHLVPAQLLDLTFAVQHNPRCPAPWLVRLPGKRGIIDLKPYGDRLGFVTHQTGDRLGFGNTFEEAARAALAAKEGSDND